MKSNFRNCSEINNTFFTQTLLEASVFSVFFTLTILACPPICATTEEEAKHCVYKSKLMMKLFTEIQLYFTWEFLSIKYFLFHLLKYLSFFLFTAKWKSFPVTLCSNIYIKSRLLHCVFHFSPEYIFLLAIKICKIWSQGPNITKWIQGHDASHDYDSGNRSDPYFLIIRLKSDTSNWKTPRATIVEEKTQRWIGHTFVCT